METPSQQIPEKLPTGEVSAQAACSPYTVGGTIRLKRGHGFRVWKITGIHYGGLGHEDLVSIRPLDVSFGSAFGQALTDAVLPLHMLTSHPYVERV